MNNAVFISYRRETSAFIARAVFQELRNAGIDAFMDIESINSGQFDTIILNQIAARPYFLPILTPGTLERCIEPEDWLLREMEHAITLNRVIVPLVTPNFSFADCTRFLREPLRSQLPRFNAVNVPHEYFDAAIEKLRTRFLTPIEIATTPTPKAEQAAVERKIKHVIAEPAVTEQDLTAQDYFERALKANDPAEAIADYTEAIRLNAKTSEAYFHRGRLHEAQGNNVGAAVDYHKTLKLSPDHAEGDAMRAFVAKWGRWLA